MFRYNDLRLDQARHTIDIEQVFSAWEAAEHEHLHRFTGSMGWKSIGGHEYLYRKIGRSSKSLGARAATTEAILAQFHQARAVNLERLQATSWRLSELAPVARALGLGRLPKLVARIVRKLADHRLLGEQLVVGTHALFAYERLAGIQVGSGMLATDDVDLLLDARDRLTLRSAVIRREGLIASLREVDASFAPAAAQSFRAVNRDGFMVDLIAPMAGAAPRRGRRISS